MQRAAVVAASRRAGRSVCSRDQAGRQHGASRDHLLEPAVQHPADQGGVARAHASMGPGTSGKCFYTGKGPKNQRCEEKNEAPARPSTSTGFYS